jgi:hypothetical protein
MRFSSNMKRGSSSKKGRTTKRKRSASEDEWPSKIRRVSSKTVKTHNEKKAPKTG